MTMWTLIERLPDGHRLFKSGGRVAIADESGPTPDTTDDGVLWLDLARPLNIARDPAFDPPREHCSIPLRTPDGEESRTPTDASTLLLLAARYAWTIAVTASTYTVAEAA